jgi:hypothetical protein
MKITVDKVILLWYNSLNNNTKGKYIMNRSVYDTTKTERMVGDIGRRLMDISVSTPMKGLKDEQIARTNRMSSFGDALTRFGTTFGPRNLEEVLKVSGVSKVEAEEFMQLGNKRG